MMVVKTKLLILARTSALRKERRLTFFASRLYILVWGSNPPQTD